MRKDTLYLTLSRDITSYTITSGQRAIATNVNYAVTIESPTLTTNLAGRDVSLIISDTDGNTLTAATTFYPDTKNPYKAVTGSLLLYGEVYGKFFDNKPVDTAVRLPIVIRDKSATLLSSDIVIVNGGEVAEPSASDEVVAGLVNAIRFYDLAEFKAWLDGTNTRDDGLMPTDIVVGQWVHTQQDGSFICKELIGAEPSVAKNFTAIVTQFPLTGTLKMNPDNGIGLSVYSGDVYNEAEATSFSTNAITYKGEAFTFNAGDNQIARQKDNYALENRVNSTMKSTLDAIKADNDETYDAMLPVRNETVEARDRAEAAASVAESSALAAGDSAVDAEDSATAADGSKRAAEAAQGKAEDAQRAAQSAQGAAQSAATSASESAKVASASEQAALTAKQAAETAQVQAKASETAAKASEASAKASETAASASEQAAKASEQAAGASATAAAGSATAAKASEQEAATSSTSAGKSAASSATSANAAANSATAAGKSATSAAASATAAAGSATDLAEAVATAEGLDGRITAIENGVGIYRADNGKIYTFRPFYTESGRKGDGTLAITYENDLYKMVAPVEEAVLGRGNMVLPGHDGTYYAFFYGWGSGYYGAHRLYLYDANMKRVFTSQYFLNGYDSLGNANEPMTSHFTVAYGRVYIGQKYKNRWQIYDIENQKLLSMVNLNDFWGSLCYNPKTGHLLFMRETVAYRVDENLSFITNENGEKVTVSYPEDVTSRRGVGYNWGHRLFCGWMFAFNVSYPHLLRLDADKNGNDVFVVCRESICVNDESGVVDREIDENGKTVFDSLSTAFCVPKNTTDGDFITFFTRGTQDFSGTTLNVTFGAPIFFKVDGLYVIYNGLEQFVLTSDGRLFSLLSMNKDTWGINYNKNIVFSILSKKKQPQRYVDNTHYLLPLANNNGSIIGTSDCNKPHYISASRSELNAFTIDNTQSNYGRNEIKINPLVQTLGNNEFFSYKSEGQDTVFIGAGCVYITDRRAFYNKF